MCPEKNSKQWINDNSSIISSIDLLIIYLSIYPHFRLSIYPSIYLSTCMIVCIPLYLVLNMQVCTYIRSYTCLFISISIHIYVDPFIHSMFHILFTVFTIAAGWPGTHELTSKVFSLNLDWQTLAGWNVATFWRRCRTAFIGLGMLPWVFWPYYSTSRSLGWMMMKSMLNWQEQHEDNVFLGFLAEVFGSK